MLSIVIPTENAEERLLPTLSALVPGAAAGIVREVILADSGSTDSTLKIADVAGCRVIEAPGSTVGARLKAGAASARSSWLMFLRPDTVLDPGWIAETSRFIEMRELQGKVAESAAVFRLGGSDMGQNAVLEALTLLRAALGGRARPEQGLVISRPFYQALHGHTVDANAEVQLLRRIGRRRIVTLRCAAVTSA